MSRCRRGVGGGEGFHPVVLALSSAVTMMPSALFSPHVLHLRLEARWLRISRPQDYKKQYLEGK